MPLFLFNLKQANLITKVTSLELLCDMWYN